MTRWNFNEGRRKAGLPAHVLAGLLPLAGLAVGCGGGGGGGGKAIGSGAPLSVLAATPTNGQETLADLSDPEVNGRLTLKFTDTPKVKSMIDSSNGFNSLTPDVQVLDQNFNRVAGTPSVDPVTRTFTFTPAGGTLTPAQYTVTVSRFVASAAGQRLNQGVEDFSTSWTVGPDVYPPVIRNTSPAANQNEVPLFTPIVISFNESLDPATCVLGQTVFVQDGGTNPPTQIAGTLELRRNGFDLVFTPDPCAGLPPSTTAVVRLLGAGNTTFIQDRIGNGLVGDPANANEVQIQFNTKGVKPLPNPANVPIPGSPRTGSRGSPFYATTADRMFAFDTRSVDADFLVNFTFKPSLTTQILENNFPMLVNAGPPASLVPGPAYGGDFETKVGRAGEGIVDWRFDLNTGHSYIYLADEANDSIAIVNTGNGKIEGRFTGVGTPRGITQTGPGQTGLSPMLFISNFGQNTVTGIPLGSFQPGLAVCSAVQELNDDASQRFFVQTGRNPTGIAAEFFGSPIMAVALQGEDEVQFIDPRDLGTAQGIGNLRPSYQVGETPTDVVFLTPINLGFFAYVANQGGGDDPDGSCSLWWSGSGGLWIFSTNTGSVLGDVQDSIKTPGKLFSDPLALTAYVPNKASDTVSTLGLQIQGGSLFASVAPQLQQTRVVGDNPTSYTYAGLLTNIGVASLGGSGQVAVFDNNASLQAPAIFNLPGVRQVFSSWDQ